MESIVLYTSLSLHVGESLYEFAPEDSTCISLLEGLAAVEKKSYNVVDVAVFGLHRGIYIPPHGNGVCVNGAIGTKLPNALAAFAFIPTVTPVFVNLPHPISKSGHPIRLS
jgi:hypothetical protein